MVKSRKTTSKATKNVGIPKQKKSKPKFNKPSDAKSAAPKAKTSNPEFQVKRTAYSKGLRSAVLASATARQRLIEMGGENTINIIRDFDKDMSDEELARTTNIKASEVRVVLNRLHNHGLFSYTRVRDRDSGWYSYIWKMSESRLREFSDKQNEGRGERTIDVGGERYCCIHCSPDAVVGFENAMDAQFKCDKCGSDLEFLERKRL